MALYKAGIFEKYNVRVLGTPVQAIIDTEDRELFVKKLDEIHKIEHEADICKHEMMNKLTVEFISPH